LYAGQWKERTSSSIVLKVWTGMCWSWIKVRITGRELPEDVEMGSPSLIWRGDHWWLHTPLEKHFAGPGTIEKQVTTQARTKMCAVDLNLQEHLAVCTIQTVEGTILATTFIGGGRRISGFRRAAVRTHWCAASVHMKSLRNAGEGESKTSRTRANPEGKPKGGQQHAHNAEHGRRHVCRGSASPVCMVKLDNC